MSVKQLCPVVLIAGLLCAGSFIAGSECGKWEFVGQFKARRYSVPDGQNGGWYHGPVTWWQDPDGYWHYKIMGP